MAIEGAMDFVAERYTENAKERAFVREQAQKFAVLIVKCTKTCDKESNYYQFHEYQSNLNKIPAHHLLAIFRGVNEKSLTIKVKIDDDRYLQNISRYKAPKQANTSVELLIDAYYNGFKRLLFPSIEREILSQFKTQAHQAAINVFADNLRALLMTPAVKTKSILGVDPGFKTGVKLAVLDKNGRYVDQAVIYPVAPFEKVSEANKVVDRLIRTYDIGNGTASREVQSYFCQYNQHYRPVRFCVVSEAGASVYSASSLAQKEHPHLDVTIRGAISIVARVQNPMAALVKIDPKSLGVGQYQHDIDQKQLSLKLHDATESIVNQVGVNLNAASAKLLSYVAGVGDKLADNIIEYRDKINGFTSVVELNKVKGLGDKAFDQCSGFMRIPQAKEPLDNTAVHPHDYNVARKLAKLNGLDKLDVTELAQQLDLGEESLKDIIKELEKPGFDPRDELPQVEFKADVLSIDNMYESMKLSGVVGNITDFGVFVDIGLKNDAMIHISQLSDRRINHPSEVVSINQFLDKLYVINVDKVRQRIGLSLKRA